MATMEELKASIAKAKSNIETTSTDTTEELQEVTFEVKSQETAMGKGKAGDAK